MSKPTTVEETYREYIEAINAQNWELIHSFLHDTVTHNNRPLSKPEYCQLMISAFDACPDIVFNIDKLLVDESDGQVACRIVFGGKPVKTFLGCEIKDERRGKIAVDFAEHVFYVFREGKIADVKSLIDVEELKRQMEG
jgi:predicted ester cyclase